MKLPTNVSESVKRRNPELYGLGSVSPTKRERSAKPALVKNPRRKRRGQERMVLVVSIIVCLRRLYDSDNSISGGTKALRDAIAESLGIDDGDKRVHWQYGMLHTTGEEGVIVRIERL